MVTRKYIMKKNDETTENSTDMNKDEIETAVSAVPEDDETVYNDAPVRSVTPDPDRPVDMCISCPFFSEQRGRFLTCPACGGPMTRRRLSLHNDIIAANKRKLGI
jgi:hypothetical protein